MLNRRLLRIRAMQHLYAYQRCRQANYELAFESVRAAFAPDLNSMEVQDTDKLNQQKQEATQLLEARLAGQLASQAAPGIEEPVVEAMRAYEQQCRKDQQFLRAQMVSRTEKIAVYYRRFLQLPEALLQEAGRDLQKKSTATILDTHSVDNLASNQLLMALRSHEDLQITIEGQNVWEAHRTEVRQLYKTVKASSEYQTYQALDNPTLEEDVALVRYIINTVALSHEAIINIFEEDGVNWDEDKKIIKSLLSRTFKSLEKSERNTVEVVSLTPNWEDDRAFFEALYDHTLHNEDEYEALISEKSKNWAADRIASLDNVIIKMAIAEMIHFSSIPVKVTINEYVDISKLYSTQKSKQFINGMLDVIAKELQQKQLIRKSGRGLMDNQ